jgi:hypothetical protein
MKTRILLVVGLCMVLAFAFTVATEKTNKGCGCGTKDQVISLDESGLKHNDARLTGLTSAFPTKCKKTCPGITWWFNKDGKCCRLGRWSCKPATVECKKGW